jgi:nicotinate-nucleotide adenylyltransferase
MKILLYGGSFDPPHNGHLNNLRAAADRVHPDKIVVMPAGTSPFKQGTNASGALRLEMCRCFAALAQEPGMPPLEVSGWEVAQAAAGSRNYTVLTLEMLARENPGAVLYLAIGSDMLLSFDSWHRWQEILRLARLVVTSRNVGDAPELHAKAKQMDPTGARILFAQVEALPMASSNLRARLAAGEACENELPALVRRVIRREGLYRADRGESGNHESETGKGACARPVE